MREEKGRLDNTECFVGVRSKLLFALFVSSLFVLLLGDAGQLSSIMGQVY